MESKKLIYADDARRAILKADPKLAYCIDKVKAVDAVEVVRCKDCKYRYYNEYQEMYCCERLADGFDTVVCQDDFCSYGERKDNG